MWAKIDLNNKSVKRVYSGNRIGNSLRVVDNSTYPADPDIFKEAPIYTYVLHVGTWLDEAEDKAEWKFSESDYVEQFATQGVKPLEQCKELVYQMLAAKRWGMETAGLDLGDGVTLPTDRETSIIIQSFPDAPIAAFKIKDGVFVKGKTKNEIIAIKLAHREFIQNAFNWESDETDKVKNMNYNELVTYLKEQ